VRFAGWKGSSVHTSSERLLRLQRFVDADPANLPLVCEFIDAAVAEGALALAAERLAASRLSDPSSVALRFREASLALAKGEFENSEKTLENMLSEGHDDPVLRHNLALARFCRGDAQAALATLEPAFGALEQHPPLARLLARVLHRLGRRNDALTALSDRLGADAQDAEARGFAALVFHEGGDLDSARGASAAALELDPMQHEALLVAATLRLDAGDAPGAEPFVRRLLGSHANSAHAWFAAAQLALLKLQLELAEEALGRAAALMPTHDRVWTFGAWCALGRGDVAVAETRIAAGVEAGADPAELAALRALAAALQGETPAVPADVPAGHPTRALIEALVAHRAGDAEALPRTTQRLLDARPGPDAPTFRELFARVLAARAGAKA